MRSAFSVLTWYAVFASDAEALLDLIGKRAMELRHNPADTEEVDDWEKP